MFSQLLIEELKKIIREDYGKDLEKREVASIGEHILKWFNLLAEIYYREKTNKRYEENKNPLK